MKKIILALIFVSLLMFPVFVFAQSAKIVDIKGDVLVKKGPAVGWEKAKMSMLLNRDAEVKTKENSQCTLAFDDELNRIMTVKENSSIKIASLNPDNIYLPQGRVFSLIKDLKKGEKFQVRTPTAVAGARATGWGTGFNDGNSSVSCFEDTVYVEGLDANGNVTGELDIDSGFGIDVGLDGNLGSVHELSDDARGEWGDFTNDVGAIIENSGDNQGSASDTGERGALQDLKNEGRETVREEVAQERREENQETREEAVSEQRETVPETVPETGGYTITPGPS